ncbi:MAG TPA: hypothetical protein VME68_06895 [Acidobacteriaceae bacterium]|nr:hypothetical protein [Acidobacteriaceae bacterium]
MKGRNIVWISLLGLGLFASGVAVGQDPGLWQRHPVLAEAEHHTHIALDKLNQAQANSGWDGAGHIQRAKDLLTRADQEIWAGARANDPH